MEMSIKEVLQELSKRPKQYFDYQPDTIPRMRPDEVQNFQELDYKFNLFNEREN